MTRLCSWTGVALAFAMSGISHQVFAEQAGAPPVGDSAMAPATQKVPPAPPAPAELSTVETRSDIMRGSGVFMTPSPEARVDAQAKGDVTLNFIGVSVQDVAKAILGDMLGLNYSVDPSAQGLVSVETTAPVRRDQVLPIFESSLEAAKLALVQKGTLYTIVPLATAQHRGAMVDMANAGYGSEAVTLRYVNAAELKKILDPLIPDNGITQSDTSRNVLFIAGSESQRQSIRNLIHQFDVNWLKGMSFALFVPQWSDSQSLAAQLTQILGAEGMPTVGLVRIVPIPQVNGVLVITPQPEYLEQARRMVETLDREGEGSQPRLFVYHVQNGRAADLASVLSASFGGASNEANTSLAAPTGLANAGRQPPSTAAAGSVRSDTGSGMSTQSGMGDQPGAKGQVTSQVLEMGAGKEVTIAADETNNALVIRAAPPQYEIIQNALRKLDVQPLQVMIEAAITEVTLTGELNYGVQWFFQKGQNTFSLTQGTTPQPKAIYPGFSYLLSNGNNIMTMLNALSDVTKVNVISSPQLFVLNNHTATLQVGDQVPISTQSAVGIVTADAPVVNSIEYRDTGVILKVTPRVNDSGLVLLDIAQEVSNVSTTSSSNIDSPTIQQRRVSSSIAVQDGQTIALGGLITDSRSKEKVGIPYLNDIPVLGNLLGNTDDKHDRTELLIMLTPRVVRNPSDARAMTEEISRRIHDIEPLPSAQKTRP